MSITFEKARKTFGTFAVSGMMSVAGVVGMTASSFHVAFDHKPSSQVTAVLEVVTPPASGDGLVFWALQVEVEDRDGNRLAGVHVGLQHYTAHPGARAVNFGGYDADGTELTGSVSTMPSATRSANTRDFPWQARTPHVLTIQLVPDGVVGSIDGREVRRLDIPGARRLVHGVVWTEDFRDCGSAPVSVRWTGLATNRERLLEGMATYQADGCDDTSSEVSRQNTILQKTGALRVLQHADRLQLA